MGWEENYLYWDFDALKAFCRSSRSKLSYTPCLKLNPLPMAYIFSVTSFRLSHLPSHHQFNLLITPPHIHPVVPTSHPSQQHICSLTHSLLFSIYPFCPSYGLQRAFSSSFDDLKMLSSLRFSSCCYLVKFWFLDSNYVFFCSYCSLCLCLSLVPPYRLRFIVVLLRRAWGKAPIL